MTYWGGSTGRPSDEISRNWHQMIAIAGEHRLEVGTARATGWRMTPNEGFDAPAPSARALDHAASRKRGHESEPPRLRVVGAHVVDRSLVLEWYCRRTAVYTYRHLWWLGLS